MRLKIKENFILIILASVILLANLSLFINIFPLDNMRQILWFVILTFLPGILIIKFFNLKALNQVNLIIYSIGISLTILMFLGLILNIIFPFFGINSPLSVNNLSIVISIMILFLCLIHYKRKNLNYSFNLNIKIFFKPYILFLILLPLLSILGTFLLSGNRNNYVLLLCIVFISITVLLAVFNKIPKRYFPLALFVISISLFFQQTLLSLIQLGGGDVGLEYMLMQSVTNNFKWNPNSSIIISDMLSIVMIPPIYSILLNIDPILVKKIIFVIFGSLIPVIIYQTYHKLFDHKFSFLAAFFFIAFPVFMIMLRSITRQLFGELFFAMFILVIFSTEMDKKLRNFLLILFSASIVVSYYGLSYIFLIFLIITALIIYLMEKFDITYKIKGKIRIGFLNSMVENINFKNQFSAKNDLAFISLTLFIFYSVMMFAWYMYTANASNLEGFIGIFQNAINSINGDFLTSSGVDQSLLLASGIAKTSSAFWVQLNGIIQRSALIFVIIGFFTFLWYYIQSKNLQVYVAFLITATFLLVLYLLIPSASVDLESSRFYQIMILVMAPCFVLGGIFFFKFISKIMRLTLKKDITYKLILIILIPYFLFNTGFVYSFTESPSGLISINSYKYSNNTDLQLEYYTTIVPLQDYNAVFWLSKNLDNQSLIYGGYESKTFYLAPYPFSSDRIKPITHVNQTLGNNVLFLNTFNTKTNSLKVPPGFNYTFRYFKLSDLSLSYNTKNKIFDNGGSNIYS